MTLTTLTQEFDALPVEEQLDYVQVLWKRVAQGPEALPTALMLVGGGRPRKEPASVSEHKGESEPMGDYRPHWAAARRRRLLFIAVWLGWMPAGYIFARLNGTDQPPGWSLGLWAIPFFWTGFRANKLQCPRCRRSFVSRGLHGNAFTGKCLNCGLPRGSPSDPG